MLLDRFLHNGGGGGQSTGWRAALKIKSFQEVKLPKINGKIEEEVLVRGTVFEVHLPEQYVEKITKKKIPCLIYTGPNKTHFVSPLSLHYLKSIKAPVTHVKEIQTEELGIKILYPLEMLLHRFPGPEVQLEIAAMALSKQKENKIPLPVYLGRTQSTLNDAFWIDRPGGSRHYWFRWDKRKKRRSARQLKALFPKLVHRMIDPNTRFVVSLGGGGLRLFAQPSVFKLVEELGGKDAIEEVWGCSGGAVTGLSYCLGADHELIEQEGYRVYRNQFGFDFMPKKVNFLKGLLSDLFFPQKSSQLKGFVDITRVIETSLARIAKHQRPRIPFYALAYNVKQQKNEVLTCEKIPPNIYNGMIKRASPIDAVLASTAIPILFVPRVIRRGKTPVTYIDGGVGEELPLLSVYKKFRIDKKEKITKHKKLFILAVNLFPQVSTLRILNSSFLRRIPLVDYLSAITRLADLLRQARIDEQINTLTSDPDVEIAQLNLGALQGVGFLDPRVIPLVIDQAKATFFKQMREIEKKLP